MKTCPECGHELEKVAHNKECPSYEETEITVIHVVTFCIIMLAIVLAAVKG